MKSKLNRPEAKEDHDNHLSQMKYLMSLIGYDVNKWKDSTEDEDYYLGFDIWTEFDDIKYFIDVKTQSDNFKGKDNFTLSEACVKRDPTNRFYCFFLYEKDTKKFKQMVFVKTSDLDYCFSKEWVSTHNNKKFKLSYDKNGNAYKSWYYLVPTSEILKHKISPMMLFK